MATMPANIDEAIDALDDVVVWARSKRTRIGYFAALYRGMTLQVRKALNEGRFRQPDRLERLDVVFVNRYLDAVNGFRNGATVTMAWDYAFRAAADWWPTVTQHLLLGCNAHVNLDLGIAVADVSRDGDLESLRPDFDQINRLLAAYIETVQDQLAGVWPWLPLLDRLSSADEAIVNYAMRAERDHAWKIAEQLHGLSDDERTSEIVTIDEQVASLAQGLRRPGVCFDSLLKIVRLGEMRSVPGIIDLLNK